MCVEAKTNHDSLVSIDLNPTEQLWDELWRCIQVRSVQHRNIFDSFRLLSIKNGHGFPRMLCDVTCFQFDYVMMHLLLQEGVTSVF